MKKKAGLLFPISALPNRYGVGDFGKNAYELVDKMAKAHIKLWQILPLNPLGYGNSPYQPLSTHAGDEIYLDLDDLKKDGLLKEEEVTYFNSQVSFVAYQSVRKEKEKLYRLAFSRFVENVDYQQFIKENDWVYNYAIFQVFKEQNHQKSWIEWEDKYKNYPKNNHFLFYLLKKKFITISFYNIISLNNGKI